MFEFIEVITPEMMHDSEQMLAEAANESEGSVEKLASVLDFFLLEEIKKNLPVEMLYGLERERRGGFSIKKNTHKFAAGSMQAESKAHFDINSLIGTFSVCPPPAKHIANTVLFTGEDAPQLEWRTVYEIFSHELDEESNLRLVLNEEFAGLDIEMHQAPRGSVTILRNVLHIKPLLPEEIPRGTLLLDDYAHIKIAPYLDS